MNEQLSYRRAHYKRMRDERRCVDCGAGVEDGGARCIEHREDASHRSREARTHSNARERDTATQRKRRARLRAQHLCSRCGGEIDTDGRWCSVCRFKVKLYEAGVTQLAPAQHSDVRGTDNHVDAMTYTPLDEREQNMRVRIMRALDWLTHDGSWVEADEILQVVGVEMDGERRGSRERNRGEVMLGRLSRSGVFVERRGTKQKYAYRISEKGRAEVKRWRSGDLPARGRKAAA